MSLFLCKSSRVESHKPPFLALPHPSSSPPPICLASQWNGTQDSCVSSVCLQYDGEGGKERGKVQGNGEVV